MQHSGKWLRAACPACRMFSCFSDAGYFMVALMIVVIDEGSDLGVKVAGQEVIF